MNKIQSILKQIEDLQQELELERTQCKHTRVIYSHGSNTGNYNPSADMYWNDTTCIDCDKRETFYSEADPTNYRLVGEIGSELQMKKEEYESFLKIQQQMGKVLS
jgi:ribosomal protein S27E